MKKIIHGAAVLLMAAILMPSAVWASSYSVSYNTISNFSLIFSGGAGSLSPFTLSVDASVTDYGLDGGLSMTDAPAACLNCSYNNSFSAHGSGSEYAYGDAQIVSRNVLAGIGAASSIGEISAFDSTGLAGGSNTMLASFTVSGSPGSLSFNFQSDPYMNTASGDSANANQVMSISISQGLTKIFEWKPDGILGNVSGGTDTSDPFSLNSSISGNTSFNPSNGYFSAATNSLALGTYSLKITMANYVSASNAAVVPLPASVWLFGSGIVSLLTFSKRKVLMRKNS